MPWLADIGALGGRREGARGRVTVAMVQAFLCWGWSWDEVTMVMVTAAELVNHVGGVWWKLGFAMTAPLAFGVGGPG